MEECQILAFRSDHLDKPGRISDQMFQYLYSADLCIAVLTGYNPNVFYELALAQSARRPVIILIEKGQLLPFDISDLRCVYYDLDIRSYIDRTHIKRVVNYIKEFEVAGWEVEDPFLKFRQKSLETECPPNLLGEWAYKSATTISKSEGICLIEIKENRLCLYGTFDKGDGTKGKWETKMSTVEGRNILYLYYLNEIGDLGPRYTEGICSVTIMDEDCTRIEGQWRLLGDSENFGNIEFNKR